MKSLTDTFIMLLRYFCREGVGEAEQPRLFQVEITTGLICRAAGPKEPSNICG